MIAPTTPLASLEALDFRELIDTIPAMIWVMDASARVTFVSRHFSEFYGLPEHELLGTRIPPGIFSDDLEANLATFERAFGAREPYQLRFRIRDQSGSYRWMESHGRPRHSPEGEFIGYAGTQKDITERVTTASALESQHDQLVAALDETLEANQAKDRFLAVLSHELRTPLTPILFATAILLRRPDLPADLRESLLMIERNVELESTLIGDLLDLTRVSRDVLEVERTPLDLHDVLHQALAICQPDLEGDRHPISLHLEATRARVLGDPARLQQVFWNLVKNAVKFSPEGGPITIRSHQETDAIVVTVTDTGIGMDATLLPRVFNAFERGAPQSPRKFGGLGIGLTLSKAIIDALGGSLRAASDGADRGSEFTVSLPVVAGQG